MYLDFERKATKAFVAKASKKIEEDISKILPTDFALDIEVEEKEIFNSIINNYQLSLNKTSTRGIKYTIAGQLFDVIAPILKRETLLLASFIRLNIIYNGNFVTISEKDFVGYTGLQRDKFYDAINNAITNKLIRRTTRKSIYIVNHNMIFKGNLSEFVVKYKEKYPEPCRLTADGKVILDR